jgi:hypothetical protein
VLQQMLEDVPAGEMLAFPDEVTIPFCRWHVLSAAGMDEDERVIRAFAAVETAVDDATGEAARNHLNNVVAEVLEENDLLPAADALYKTLFTDEAEHAARGHG